MRLNPDCVRDVMLSVEELGFKDSITIDELNMRLPQYTEDELHYTALKLYEADMLSALTCSFLGAQGEFINCIYELTYNGHSFLDNIRDNSTFKEAKSKILKTVGSASIEIMARVTTDILLRKLGL